KKKFSILNEREKVLAPFFVGLIILENNKQQLMICTIALHQAQTTTVTATTAANKMNFLKKGPCAVCVCVCVACEKSIKNQNSLWQKLIYFLLCIICVCVYKLCKKVTYHNTCLHD